MFTYVSGTADPPWPVLMSLSWSRWRRLYTSHRQDNLHCKHSHTWSVQHLALSLVSFVAPMASI